MPRQDGALCCPGPKPKEANLPRPQVPEGATGEVARVLGAVTHYEVLEIPQDAGARYRNGSLVALALMQARGQTSKNCGVSVSFSSIAEPCSPQGSGSWNYHSCMHTPCMPIAKSRLHGILIIDQSALQMMRSSNGQSATSC